MMQQEKVGDSLPHVRPGMAVRFPLPTQKRERARSPWSWLAGLLPATWRRQVVIQGCRYWLPD